MRRCLLAGRSLCGLCAIGRPAGRTVRSRNVQIETEESRVDFDRSAQRFAILPHVILAYSSLHVVTLRLSAEVVQEPAGGLRVIGPRFAAGQMLSKSPEQRMLTADRIRCGEATDSLRRENSS
jgi:hypothetical protein